MTRFYSLVWKPNLNWFLCYLVICSVFTSIFQRILWISGQRPDVVPGSVDDSTADSEESGIVAGTSSFRSHHHSGGKPKHKRQDQVQQSLSYNHSRYNFRSRSFVVTFSKHLEKQTNQIAFDLLVMIWLLLSFQCTYHLFWMLKKSLWIFLLRGNNSLGDLYEQHRQSPASSSVNQGTPSHLSIGTSSIHTTTWTEGTPSYTESSLSGSLGRASADPG